MPDGQPESPEAAAARTLRRRADALTWTLLYADLPAVDQAIAVEALRTWVAETLPDRLPLFEMIYAARWERLRAQGWARNAPRDLS